MSAPNKLPAFPSNAETDCTGMTLRDYFAAKALQGMLANPNIVVQAEFHIDNFKTAYKAADAMMKARAA